MFPIESTGLYTDHYELTMAQGYFLSNRHEQKACFDYFFRKIPYGGGYVVFSGLSSFLELLKDFHYTDEDCQYLLKIGFQEDFVNYLRHFSFKGNIYSVREGEIIFPAEPVLHVEGNIFETQLIETMLLNILNFESLIATKASRCRLAAGNRLLLEFGLRRAQGLGGINASKAAIQGGFDQTSNVYSAAAFGLKSSGTMAHSWIQSFGDELEAFRAYARFFPDACTLLVDTYDTLKSGIPNAITVAYELMNSGHRLIGIRLDSGDLTYLSRKAREMLDQAGLQEVKIVVSNQLDEHIIESLLTQGAPIDVFGVGTSLATGKSDAAMDGVYKLSEIDGHPTIKLSDNIGKMTLPGIKSLHRYTDANNKFVADGISLAIESGLQQIYHPIESQKHYLLAGLHQEDLQKIIVQDGHPVKQPESPEIISAYVQERLQQLPEGHKRFLYPHVYKVGISKKLMHMRDKLIVQYRGKGLPQ